MKKFLEKEADFKLIHSHFFLRAFFYKVSYIRKTFGIKLFDVTIFLC